MSLATHHAGLEPVEAEIDRGPDQRHAGAQRELHRQRQPAERVGTLGEVPGSIRVRVRVRVQVRVRVRVRVRFLSDGSSIFSVSK